MKFDPNKMYIVEGDTLEFLTRLATRLYNEHQPWKLGEKRDWANDLYNVHLPRFRGI